MDVDKITRKKYEDIKNKMSDERNTNNDNYDKTIISLTSAFLVASVLYLKTAEPNSQFNYLWMLFTAWIFYVLTINVVILSYILREILAENIIRRINRFLSDSPYSYMKKPHLIFIENIAFQANYLIVIFKGILFVWGIIITFIFIALNTI